MENEIKFTVDNVKCADNFLETKDFIEIIKKISGNIEAYCNINDKLVSFGSHSFISGMHRAYAEHRPFVISPDMIWLLIIQAFANHVFYNKEDLRNMFVNFENKKELEVINNELVLGKNDSTWKAVFPEFTKKISDIVGKELIDALTSDFTTTTMNEKIASQITIMNAMEPYFDYIVTKIICGFPHITLKGTTTDWLKIIEKIKILSNYKFQWWTEKVIPIIENIVETSKGKINIQFWQEMFKIHNYEIYGNPELVDGWIFNFFPYDNSGNKISFEKIEIISIEKNSKLIPFRVKNGLNIKKISKILPPQIVNVNFKYVIKNTIGEKLKEIPMLFWSGFVGLKQDEKEMSLEPRIGWFISYKSENKRRIDKENKNPIIFSRVENLPDEIFDLNSIDTLILNFVDKINISDKIKSIQIKKLILNGKISEDGITEIIKLLPNTELQINGKWIKK